MYDTNSNDEFGNPNLVEKPKKEIVKREKGGIVMPAVSTDEALEAWKQYQDLKKKIVEKNDIQIIEGKDFLKKSYWRKIATFFNLSTEVVSEKYEQIGKTFVYNFTCKAIAPNGRTAIGTGSCDAFEKAKLINGVYKKWNKFKKIWEEATSNSIHNIRSTAETRATNRAISNLVGGGEVSADEIVTEPEHDPTEEWDKNDAKPAQNEEIEGERINDKSVCKTCGKVLTAKELKYSDELCYIHQKKAE